MAATRPVGGVLLLLIVLVVSPLAAAQTLADPAITLTALSDALDLDADDTATFALRVANPGNVDGNVALVATAPAGWLVALDAENFVLVAGASRDVQVTVTAPSAASGAAAGEFAATATLTDAAGRATAANAAVAVTRVDPPVVVPPPFWQTAPGIAALAGGVVAVVAIIALVWRTRRQRAAARAAWDARELGLTLSALSGPSPVGADRSVAFRMVATNTTNVPRVAQLTLDAPEGWRASLSLARVALGAGQRSELTLLARPESQVPANSAAEFAVRARWEDALDVEVPLSLEAVALNIAPAKAAAPPLVRAAADGSAQPALRR